MRRCAPSISAGALAGSLPVAEALRALELDEVYAGYGDTVVLENINLALGEGETLAIIGRNGVGKSTLLATIMGHTTLHGGALRLRGKNISQLVPYRRVYAGLGYVPQEREIFPSLTLRENLEVAVRPGRWAIDAVFELFPKLAERQANRGNQLSGGEQQMLAIGRALVGNPAVLLMDEPSEGLAPVIVQTTLNVGTAIIDTAGLSFLGLGTQPPTPDWGNMLAGGRSYVIDAPWIATFPGLAILVTVLAFNLMGDALRDAFDPRLR